jgi:hypothetical protein
MYSLKTQYQLRAKEEWGARLSHTMVAELKCDGTTGNPESFPEWLSSSTPNDEASQSSHLL